MFCTSYKSPFRHPTHPSAIPTSPWLLLRCPPPPPPPLAPVCPLSLAAVAAMATSYNGSFVEYAGQLFNESLLNEFNYSTAPRNFRESYFAANSEKLSIPTAPSRTAPIATSYLTFTRPTSYPMEPSRMEQHATRRSWVSNRAAFWALFSACCLL